MNEYKELIKNIYEELSLAIEAYENAEGCEDRDNAFYQQIVGIAEQISGF